MRLVVARDAEQLAEMAAELFRDRVRARPELAMAVPAGRTPRRMYRVLQALQATAPVDYSRMRVFSVDELCPPAPADGTPSSCPTPAPPAPSIPAAASALAVFPTAPAAPSRPAAARWPAQ